MSEHTFCNVYDEIIANDLLMSARKGDKSSQKLLYLALENEIRPIEYSYISRCQKCGINFDDLDNLCSKAFLICFNHFDDRLGNLCVYYKYIYSNLVKSEIRQHLQATNYQNFSALGYEDTEIDDLKDRAQVRFENEIKNYIDNNEIYQLIMNNYQVKLNKSESHVLKFFFNDYNSREISEKTGLDYNAVSRYIRTGLEKIKKFINFDELKSTLNSSLPKKVIY